MLTHGEFISISVSCRATASSQGIDLVTTPELNTIEKKPLRYQRTTGLTTPQLQELVARIHEAMIAPWQARIGRRKSCGLYRATQIVCMYLRQNVTQEYLAEVMGVSQPTVSRIVARLVPIAETVLAEFVPTEVEASARARGRVCLVDGTITPCWSYDDHRELWSRKKGTTGFNTQVVSLLDGTPVYISDPLPGHTHDTVAFEETPVATIVEFSGGAIADGGYKGHIEATPRRKPRGKGGELSENDKQCNTELSRLRAPVERTIAHFKSWRILHTDYRRPYDTYELAFKAARALFFFSIEWDYE